MKHIISILFVLITARGVGQSYTPASVFSHNDYQQRLPLYAALNEQVVYIEADVFLSRGKLLVAHTTAEISETRSLDEMYLRPLQQILSRNNGKIYTETSHSLTLMIDVKSDALGTLQALVTLLKKYPTLTESSYLRITISGNIPDPTQWKAFPGYITFDGRPGVAYTPEQLKRIALVSDDFRRYSSWNGKGRIPTEELDKLEAVIDRVHQLGKKIRFWGSPDLSNAWMTFINLGADVLNTDQVDAVADYLRKRPSNTYTHGTPHSVYTPANTILSAKPKNVILLVGDGMGLTQMFAGYTANRGSLNIFKIKTIGFSVTTSADHYITDSAAGATAMATGSKTKNRYVSVDTTGRPLVPLTTVLKTKGFQNILISSGDITDATPAAFYAHQTERSLSEAIATDLLNGKIDIVIGAGVNSFVNRKDSVNLLQQFENKGFVVSQQVRDLDTLSARRFLMLDNQAGKRMLQGRGNFLADAFHASVRSYSRTKIPFFMMAEGAQIDWGGHANELNYVVTEMLDFDQLVGSALAFADADRETLVVVTADHETGGLSLTGGDVSNGSVEGNFSTADHTAVLVPVFAYGPGAERFQGVFPNTEIYHKIKQLLAD